MSKKRMAALGASAASAALVGSALFAPAAVAQEAPASPSAYAIEASGIISVPKSPHVVNSGEESVVAVDLPPGAGAIVHAGVFNAEASEGHAKGSVAEARLGLPAAPVIEAETIVAECNDGVGSFSILNLRIGDREINIDQIPKNQPVVPEPLQGIASITLNKQVTHDDGSLTVTGIAVNLLDSTQTLNLASATCGPAEDGGETTPPTTPPDNGEDDGDKDNGDDDNGDKDKGDGDDAEEDGTAPTPVPQPDHIAVTG